ncbi:MAG TPA: hypothetical protein VIU41_08250 [Geobacteraceae bacterium]
MEELVGALRRGETLEPVMTGPMWLAPYHEGERFVPASVQEMLVELAAGLRSGRVVTNVAREKPSDQ